VSNGLTVRELSPVQFGSGDMIETDTRAAKMLCLIEGRSHWTSPNVCVPVSLCFCHMSGLNKRLAALIRAMKTTRTAVETFGMRMRMRMCNMDPETETGPGPGLGHGTGWT